MIIFKTCEIRRQITRTRMLPHKRKLLMKGRRKDLDIPEVELLKTKK